MVATEVRKDWILGNPWFWIGVALTATGLARLWVAMFADGWELVRFFYIGLGMLAAGGAIAIRLSSTRPAYLETASQKVRSLVLVGLVLAYGVIALTWTVLVLLRLAGMESIPWKPGHLVVVWLLVVPVSVRAAWICSQKQLKGSQITAAEEGAALVYLAAWVCFLAGWALYLGEGKAEQWDTIRMLLSAMGAVAVVASPLLVLPLNVRRAMISLLIILHFGGITSAVLSSPPIPWIVTQIWTRFYRPYLEFMYLNNAYHFYSPEPGPASYLWFRLTYVDPRGDFHGQWMKVPDMDDKGSPRYPLALEYQRYLALTEQTAMGQFIQPLYEPTGAPAEFFARRLQSAPHKLKVGEKEPALMVPFHPFVEVQQQRQVPTLDVKNLLESYVRHVAQAPYPDHPEYELYTIKVYRVLHLVPLQGLFLNGADPNDPEFYRPFFMGEYNAHGQLMDARDPLLYWLLPIGRERVEQRGEIKVIVRDFARKHAGDKNWVRVGNDRDWIEWHDPVPNPIIGPPQKNEPRIIP